MPVRRWGGNSTSRYNWQIDASNHASDWFFYNLPEATAKPSTLPNGSTADVFIDATRAASGPGADHRADDRLDAARPHASLGFLGAQVRAAAGDRVHRDGQRLLVSARRRQRPPAERDTDRGNNPADTSKTITPTFITNWMAHIAGRTGTAAQGGVRLFELDNEPMLWNSTHRDVHPKPVTYDELWQKTKSYAVAMKAKDPSIQILGPSDWGWCAYFFSAADGCSAGRRCPRPWQRTLVRVAARPGPRLPEDLRRAAHRLRRRSLLSAGERRRPLGRRVGRHLALRLRSLKGLYDPSYVDESWIGQPTRMIPRMKEWIAAALPGAKIAISEYNWGNDDGPSKRLAQAEALAISAARESISRPAGWLPIPAAGSRMPSSSTLDYDGRGSKVAGGQRPGGQLQRRRRGRLCRRGAGRQRSEALRPAFQQGHRPTGRRRVQVVGGVHSSPWRSTGSAPPAGWPPPAPATPAGGALSLTLPARSATLVVVVNP